jgi:hypothetical protein
MDLSLNGKHVSSPQVVTKEGETTTVIQESNGQKIFMEVVATENPKALSLSVVATRKAL